MDMGSQPSASWAKNTIMTECTQESGHLQFMYYLVCGQDIYCSTTGKPTRSFATERVSLDSV